MSIWTTIFSGHTLAVALLLYFAFLHASGLYLFTRGFLLSRLALPDVSTSSPATTLPPTHSRALVIIIDALRFDFVSPDPPEPASPFHHRVLRLPAELTEKDPSRSFLFYSYSDPPTTTLQRLKGITTGSLPTFIDAGSNFHSSSILEDSIINQLQLSDRFPLRSFLGDDTWLSIYPDSFTPNLTHPFDSFNVEDLHTVDAGVTRELIPLLTSQRQTGTDPAEQPFQFLVAHFLGVDHVGHRLGPDHPAMQAKLEQMDTLLRLVTAHLQEDTLLVLLGDHGMDPKGDHGGDSPLEVSTTTWFYSSGAPLSTLPFEIPGNLARRETYPGASKPARYVQQIDLVPTLSLLLGLPIPFNNLGTVIPELFWRPNSELEKALKLNGAQVWQFFNAYRASSSGSELDEAWEEMERAWVTAKSQGMPPPTYGGQSAGDEARIAGYTEFTRLGLETCRALWAQFDVILILLGLTILLLAVCVNGIAYWALATHRETWEDVTRRMLGLAAVGACEGGLVGYFWKALVSPHSEMIYRIGPLYSTLFTSAIFSAVLAMYGLVTRTDPTGSMASSTFTTFLAGVAMALHAGSFTSNSFILWEDHVAPYLTITLLLPTLIRAPSSPTHHLLYRLLGFPLLLATCVRLMSISTVCREEQHPNCHVTFYSSSTVPVAPALVLGLALPVSYFLPLLIRTVLGISKSDQGLAPIFLQIALRASLFSGSVYWVLDWLESWHGLNPERKPLIQSLRVVLARGTLVSTAIFGSALWYFAPLCVDVQIQDETGEGGKKQVIIVGFANSYGSTYLLFFLVFFALIFAVTQLTGQLVLALFIVALLAHLEAVDSTRDVETLHMITPSAKLSVVAAATTELPHRPPTLSDIVILALLGHVLFFATGHQAVISTIQWKSAFVGFLTLTYPWAPILVVLNSLGPFFLAALAVPLLATWNVSPVPRGKTHVLADTVKACTGFVWYHALVAFGCAVCAAWLRRHLMVWKVFAPRFMLAGLTLAIVDVGVVVAVSVGSAVTCRKVKKMFGTEP